jgi:SAM-dependent methyltransferase
MDRPGAGLTGRGEQQMDEAVYREMADVQSAHWWYRGRRHILATVIESLKLPQAPRILEAGCGPGGNLPMLATFGTVSAFEPHDGARGTANAKAVATVRSGTLPDGIPFPENFDLVCAFDVIEHVEDDVSAVRALGAKLAPGGRLLLTVPAHPWMWSEHDVRNHHHRRYTRDTLAQLLGDAGLTIDKLTAFNSHLFPLVAGTRILQNSLGLGAKAEEAVPGPAMNSLLEKIFAAEAPRVAAAGYSTGVSLLAVASTGPAGRA